MAFQIKDFNSSVLSQINHARGVTSKITDFQPGSVARTLMEAPAVEVEELYLQMFLGLRDAIPVATFLSFGFDRLPAARARGMVSVSAEAPPAESFLIPVGTKFTALDGRSFSSTQGAVWLSNSLIVLIPVSADVVGLAGNSAEGVITASPAFGDAYAVSNSAITTGRDIETDPDREARFAEFVASLSQGTVLACGYKAGQALVLGADGNIDEYVTRRGLLEEAGYARIYIYGSAGVPSAALLSNAQVKIDGARDPVTGAVIDAGSRAAGIKIDVLSMVERAVPLSVQIGLLPGYTMTSAIIQQLGDIFAAAMAGVQPGTTLYLGDLVDNLLAADGVLRVVPVSNSNIVCAINEVLTAGTLTTSVL